ncbi:MAG: vWA domain-containing protein [Pyrinomonadaceae bacterium]
MTWVILMLLAFTALWVGAGMLILALNGRRLGGDYRREVSRRVYALGDDIEVKLHFVPPARMQAADDHDVLLAIDHSGSMGGGPGSPLREAVRAAENFVRRLPDNIRVGVVTFDHEARLLAPLGSDHRRALRAMGSIGSGGGTSIHEALNAGRMAMREARPAAKKTVVLLSDGASDYDAAVRAASRLCEEVEGLNIICIGVGAEANEELLRAIANAPGNYLKVGSVNDLYALFSLLASIISGQMAGLIDECARAPRPFRLAGTGELYPIGVQPGEPTHITWSVSLTGEALAPLTYNLVAACPGWHAVAAPGSKVVWRMCDGERREQTAPDGPRVLVMPRWLGWAWPLLNPLFWMLFGRFWPCAGATRDIAPAPAPEPLPRRTLPTLLPAPQERPYRPRVRPALVVGLGETGEWTVCRLKERLHDRDVDPSLVEVRAVHATHHVNRRPVRVGRPGLDESERVELFQDLRPYLESLRAAGAPPSRKWVPWRHWLEELPPLTTVRDVADDRRKARLALIRQPSAVESALKAPLRRVIEADGLIVVVGSPVDAECSGMLAEVAHICAAAGASVTAVFAPTSFFRQSAEAELALAQELERMSLMRGRKIVSDRSQPPAEAAQLFDRVVVLELQRESTAESSLPAAELLWHMLAYEEVFERLPVLRADGDEVICSGVVMDGLATPAAHLWEWLRERTLAVGVNRQRLGLKEEQGRLTLPAPDRQAVRDDVEAFWSGQGCTRPQSPLLRSSRHVLQATGDNVSALLSMREEMPVDRPYHEQVAYGRRERQLFAAYLEEWAQGMLNREQAAGSWGLHALMSAVLRVEDDLQLVLDRLNRLSGNADFASLVGFASSLYADLLATTAGLRSGLAQWLSHLAGPQVELRVGPPPAGVFPAAFDIERERAESEKALAPFLARGGNFLERQFEQWYGAYASPALDRLRFEVKLDVSRERVEARLMNGETAVGVGDNLAAALRGLLEPYRNVPLAWPLEQLLPPVEVADPLDRFRVGKHSALIFPKVTQAADEEDPHVAAAILVRQRTIREALWVATTPTGEIPYTWPEEANAARIAEKIRNRLLRTPSPFSALAVHLMHNPLKLYGFFNDLASSSVEARGSVFVLRRGGREYVVGPPSDMLRGIDLFEAVAQQVVSSETSLDGELIAFQAAAPMSLEEMIQCVEAHPLVFEATRAPAWAMWRDVICGLWLDHSAADAG